MTATVHRLPTVTYDTREDCVDGPRPCAFIRCRHRIEGGACSLDYADAGPMTSRDVAAALGLSPQGVLDIENDALRKLRRSRVLAALNETEAPEPGGQLSGALRRLGT